MDLAKNEARLKFANLANLADAYRLLAPPKDNAADSEVVLEALLPHRGPGLKFLEWGSASGVITIMADFLGFQACGIELEGELVEIAEALAARYDSKARFVEGSFLSEVSQDSDPGMPVPHEPTEP